MLLKKEGGFWFKHMKNKTHVEINGVDGSDGSSKRIRGNLDFRLSLFYLDEFRRLESLKT